MDKLAKVLGGSLMFSAMLIIAAPLHASIGALAGWSTGLLWGETIHKFILGAGLPDMPLWRYGATLGFFSSFLRTQTTVKHEK